MMTLSKVRDLGSFILKNWLVVLLILAVAVQTVRLNGLLIWPFKMQGWVELAKDRKQTINAMEYAQLVAADKAVAARLEQEAAYRDISERIDDEAGKQIDGNLERAERFIAAGGVRGKASGNSCGQPRASAENRGTGNIERAGAAAELDEPGNGVLVRGAESEDYVTVLAEDVRICTVNTVKAEAAHRWATELEESADQMKGNDDG